MLTRNQFFHPIAALLLALTACDGTQYEVHVTPDEGGFARRVTSKLRGAARDISEGHFESIVPDDMGGAGFQLVLASPAGSVRFYVERTRGTEDPWTQVERIETAADGVCELAVLWLGRELADQRAWGEIRETIEVDLERALKNLAIELWAGTRSGQSTWELGVARLVQWSVEAGLFQPEELLGRLADCFMTDECLPMALQRIVMMLEERHGPEGLELQSLAFLHTPESALASLDALANHPQYLALLKRWRRQGLLDFGADPVLPRELLSTGLEALLTIPSVVPMGVDSVTFRLVCPTEPLMSPDGEWDAEQSIATWTTTVQEDGLPRLFYALWVEPNEAWQGSHFGRVLLQADELARYTFWYELLSDRRRQEWDLFLEGLQPSASLRQELMEFRFSDHVEGREDYSGLIELADALDQ